MAPIAALATSCAAPAVVPADGRLVDFDFVQSGGAANANFYQVAVTKGHSYSVEVRQDYDGVNTDIDPASGVSVFSDAACGVAVTGLVDTSTAEPSLPSNSFRQSFTAAATGNVYIQVTNGGGQGRYISVRVDETTLYNPTWANIAGFVTAFTISNTTGSPITGGKLIFFDASGTQVGSANVTLPANGGAVCYGAASVPGVGAPPNVNCTFTTAPGTGTGTAIFSHNGPPSGVLAAGFTQRFLSNPAFVQPVDLKPIRGK